MKTSHAKTLPIVLVLLCLSPLSVVASDKGPVEQLTLSSYLLHLRSQHPSYIKESLNRELAKKDVQIQDSGQDWELNLTAQQAHQETLLPSFGPEKVDQSLVRASLGRQVWKTGAFVSVGAEASIDDNHYAGAGSPFSQPSESQKQELNLTVSQPLLKNFKGSQSRLAYDLSRQSERLTDLQALEAQESFLATMADEYLDWTLLAEQENINEERLRLAQIQRREIKKRYDTNLVERVDFLRSQDSERLANQQYLLSRSQYIAKTHSLAHQSNMPKILNQEPSFKLYQIPELPDLDATLGKLRTESRTLKTWDGQKQQLQRRLSSLRNQERPELNLDLRTALKSEDQEGLAPGEKDSDDGKDYSVGLNFKHTLGKSSAEGEREKLQIQLNQIDLDMQYSLMRLEANVRELYVQLQAMRNILALNKESISAAKETTREELKTYQQGRSDLTNVISSRDQIQNARLVYAQNAANYHKLFLQMQSLSDQLLVSTGGE